jgi:hypothetical protein
MKNQTGSRGFSARYDLYQLICVMLATIGGMSQVIAIILSGYVPDQYQKTCEYVGHGLAICCFTVQIALMRWMRSDKVAIGVVMDKMSSSLSAVGVVGDKKTIDKQGSKFNNSGYLNLIGMAQKHLDGLQQNQPKQQDTDSLLGDDEAQTLVKLNGKYVMMMNGLRVTTPVCLMSDFVKAVFTAEFKNDDSTIVVKDNTVLPMSLMNQPMTGCIVEKYNPFYIFVTWGVRADGTWYVANGTAIPMPGKVKQWALNRAAAGRPHFAFKDAPWINDEVRPPSSTSPQKVTPVMVTNSMFNMYPNIVSDQPFMPDQPPPYPVATCPV